MNKIIISVFLSFLILACNDKNSIVENEPEPEKREIDLFAKFVVDDSTYFFDFQNLSNRYLSNVSLGNYKGICDSILIGYHTRFSGGDNSLDLFINKKLIVSDLENTPKYPTWLQYSESVWYWVEYEPTQNEFESMFIAGQKNILKEHYFWTEEEGVALFLNDFNWTSYNQQGANVPDSDWQVNSKFEIYSMEYINNEEILNLSPKGDFTPIYADTSVNYMLIDFSFTVKLFNKADSTKTLEIHDGQIKAIVFK